MQDPKRDPDFGRYFTSDWAVSVMFSLRNAVSVVFQHTPRPVLLQFDVLAMKLEQLSHSDHAHSLTAHPHRYLCGDMSTDTHAHIVVSRACP